jgi:cob(I)alamin adenosyltransferase
MVKLNKIYTRTGDAGTTGLVDGSRLPKHAPRMQAVGDVDEANSAIGLAILAIGDTAEAAWLTIIQNDLFDLGADLATPVPEGEDEPWALRIIASQVKRLEEQIDAMNADLQPLDSFILPGGSPAAAAVHLARAITRRAERSATAAAVEVLRRLPISTACPTCSSSSPGASTAMAQATSNGCPARPASPLFRNLTRPSCACFCTCSTNL